MIVYQATKHKFLNDVLSNKIEQLIQNALLVKTGRHVGVSEIGSWKESLRYLGSVLNDEDIPSDAGVSIEYHIPQTSKRIDFILTGRAVDERKAAVLIELKQWSEALPTNKDGVVITRFKGGQAETSHPSYQVWSYAVLLESFNEAVYGGDVGLYPCAYLHNYQSDDVISNSFYKEYLDKAPVFFSGEDEESRLRDFIKRNVKYGDTDNIIYQIDSGRIRPSKSLVDSLARMLTGNEEFLMIDDQKVVFETAREVAKFSSDNNRKHVLIVEGGPGTGKTVVAINLLVELTKLNLVTKYVTKNAAPRAVYESKLTGTIRKSVFTNLFTGSGAFTETFENEFDALIVDEAHRLNEKSGMFKNQGQNQVKEIIASSKFSIFFIDENQQVTWGDIGTKDEIRVWAKELGATVIEKTLESQFRCNGSDGYLAWLDDVLQIRDTANTSFEPDTYDFQVFDTPALLFKKVQERNGNNKSRIVAGYCWNWVSKGDLTKDDVVLPEYGFSKKWNLASDGSLWILNPDSINEVGCIHTCQGLELDYIGVIIGDDLVVRDGKVYTRPDKRARTDKSLIGLNKAILKDRKIAFEKADRIIKNTYRTLMTRGMKGCYIFCTDPETSEYFKRRLITPPEDPSSFMVDTYEDFELGFQNKQ